MLIAALDPQKSQHMAAVATPQPAVSLDQAAAIANNGCSSAGLPGAGSLGALWSSVQGAGPGSYGGLPWNNVPSSMPACADVAGASRRASDAALLNAYQLGRPRDGGGDNSPAYVQFDRNARKGSYPPGIKRPFSDFDHLLSAADMYAATASTTDQAASAHMPAKHARHDSIIDCSSSGGYGDSAPFMPTEAAAAAAAAVAAASISYSTGAAFDSLSPAAAAATGGNGNILSLDAGMSMMPGGPAMSQPHLAQGLQMGVGPGAGYHHHGHHHSRSLSFSRADHRSQMLSSSLQTMGGSPMACATSSAGGYLYDGLAMDGGAADGPANGNGGGFMVSSHPIPSIPGVTVSPKEQPRRLSVPDLSPPPAEESNASTKAQPRRQKVRFSDDMYTPMWVRNNGQQKEGFCDTCAPGKWLQLKNSAFWYHKQFFHGISSVSGRPFIRPLQ
ncbi:hypothetical protein GGF38_004404, partial [Coemansia sp. RSA 25]